MKLQVDVHETKTHLSELLHRVMNGKEIIIAIAGKPVARLLPFHPAPQPRQPGNDTGQVVIAADFDEPLTDFDDARDQQAPTRDPLIPLAAPARKGTAKPKGIVGLCTAAA